MSEICGPLSFWRVTTDLHICSSFVQSFGVKDLLALPPSSLPAMIMATAKSPTCSHNLTLHSKSTETTKRKTLKLIVRATCPHSQWYELCRTGLWTWKDWWSAWKKEHLITSPKVQPPESALWSTNSVRCLAGQNHLDEADAKERQSSIFLARPWHNSLHITRHHSSFSVCVRTNKKVAFHHNV